MILIVIHHEGADHSMNKVIKMLVVPLAFLLVLAGCHGNSNKQSSDNKDKETTSIKLNGYKLKLKGNQSVLLRYIKVPLTSLYL